MPNNIGEYSPFNVRPKFEVLAMKCVECRRMFRMPFVKTNISYKNRSDIIECPYCGNYDVELVNPSLFPEFRNGN